MKTLFRKSFVKDLEKIRKQSLKDRVRGMIDRVEQVENVSDLTGLKKLRRGEKYYRIRLGNYRVGVIIESDTVTFVRFLHRKDIYKYFP